MSVRSLTSSFGGNEDVGDIGVDHIEGMLVVLSAFPSACTSVKKDLCSVHYIVSLKHLVPLQHTSPMPLHPLTIKCVLRGVLGYV
jgi:hypothetical protein